MAARRVPGTTLDCLPQEARSHPGTASGTSLGQGESQCEEHCSGGRVFAQTVNCIFNDTVFCVALLLCMSEDTDSVKRISCLLWPLEIILFVKQG